MVLTAVGVAGTLESSDILITVEPRTEDGIAIELKSTVEKQFGTQIRAVIAQTAHELGIERASISAVDKGALDCTVRARTQAALCRAAGSMAYRWEVLAK